MHNVYQQYIAAHATQLLRIFHLMFDLWPAVDAASGAASLAIAAGSAPAAVRLALTSRYFVSSKLRQAKLGPPANAAVMLNLLNAADDSIINLVANITNLAVPIPGVLSRVPEIKQLFLSPHFMPCLMVMIATLATRLLRTPGAGPTGPNAPGGANSSNSSRQRPSAPSSSQARDHSQQQRLSGGDQVTAAHAEAEETWQQACTKQSRLTPTHHKLFESLGVDSRAALWTTGAMAETSASPSTLMTHLAVYNQILIQWEDFHHVWQGVDPHALLWLAAAVLQCVAGMPADSIKHVARYRSACTSFTDTLACWSCLMQQANPTLRVVDDTAELQSQQVLAQPTVRQQPKFMLLPPAEFVSEVLPHLLTLCSRLQVAPSADVGPTPTPASASLADRSKPGSRDPNLPATTESKMHAFTEVVSLLYWLLLPVMAVQEAQLTDTHLAGAHRTASATATEAAVAGAAATLTETDAGRHFHTAPEHYLALFQVHALKVMICMEGAVRCVVRTAASAASSLACDDTLIEVSGMCHGDMPGAASWGPLLIMARAAGPGSSEQRQVYSLLSSMLKLRHCSMEGVQRAAQYCRMAAAGNAVALLSQQTGGSREAGADFEGLAGSTAAGADDSSTKTVHADLSDLLPSLFIFGCCCLQWAEQLRQEIPSQLLQLQVDAGQQAASDAEFRLLLEAFFNRPTGEFTCSASHVCFIPMQHADGLSPLLLCWLHSVGGWLQSSDTSAQLASVGYDPQQLLQQLNGVVSALNTAVDNTAKSAPLLEFVQQLHGLGVALASVATPHACNNPNCSNVSGPSELQLVSGRSCMCAGCRTARYCSKACQKQHWKQHKPACKALAAAKATTIVSAPT